MPKLEIKSKSELSRKEVSERLIAIGHALASGSEVEMGSGGDSIEIVVGDHVEWELEIEVDGDKTEIEIEISWRDNPSGESGGDLDAVPAVPRKAARRARARKATAK
ncbi:amphi-Trp domain-containing protein [Nocardia sp. NBC_01377]|uniref:amphi-Trp domain-containing protein n=1 Tax=Nocardia sp. NBC_01377 TaxID=2903595 RepID=UPI0032505068